MFERYIVYDTLFSQRTHTRTHTSAHAVHVELVARRQHVHGEMCKCLTAETVQGASLALQSVDDVHGGDGLPLGVLGVSDGVTDDVL